MFDNTIATIFALMSKDTKDPLEQSEQLEALYEIATNSQKKAIDNALICICGYRLDTIINNPEIIKMEYEK